MRNKYLDRLEKQVKVRISGSNINSYLKRVIKNKINYIKLIPISYKEAHVILKYKEYLKLKELKSIYKVEVINSMGLLKVKEGLVKNTSLVLFLVLGLIMFRVLTNVIFSIDIVHSDREIRELVREELKKYGVDLYKFKLDYQELEIIKKRILEENKDILEWLEIANYGTKYIVRVEERKLNKNEDNIGYQSIVSKKDAVIVGINAVSGEKVKFVNDYVKKGQEIISGYITKPNGEKIIGSATGTVLGEVWYEVTVDYPIVYEETKYTGKFKKVFAIYFWNKRYGLFDFKEFRNIKTRSKVLYASEFPNIKLVYEKQYEVIIKDEVYTEDIAKVRAIDYIKDKLINDNKQLQEFVDVEIISTSSDEDSVTCKLFVRAIEDIGEVKILNYNEAEEKEVPSD